MSKKTLYGIRIIEPSVEGQLFRAAVMYSSGDAEGPWHDMVSGHYEWCEEVLEALITVSLMVRRDDD